MMTAHARPADFVEMAVGSLPASVAATAPPLAAPGETLAPALTSSPKAANDQQAPVRNRFSEIAWAAATKATSVATARQRASMEELNHKDRTTQRAVAYSHYIAASSH